MANIKLENFVRLKSLYPEYRFVFFGDSGHGDIKLGEELLRRARECPAAATEAAECGR
jgi:hypothetical protein